MLVHGFEITKNTTSHVLVSSSHTHTLETGFFWTSKHFLHFFHFFFFLNFLSLPTRQLANSSPTRAGWTQDLFFQLARWPSRCSARRFPLLRSALAPAPSLGRSVQTFLVVPPPSLTPFSSGLTVEEWTARGWPWPGGAAVGVGVAAVGVVCCCRCYRSRPSCPWWTSLSRPLTSVPRSRSVPGSLMVRLVAVLGPLLQDYP